MRWNGESVHEWVYSQAERCCNCSNRAIIPTQEIANRFVMKSEGRLIVVHCPVGNGVHLVNPSAELVAS